MAPKPDSNQKAFVAVAPDIDKINDRQVRMSLSAAIVAGDLAAIDRDLNTVAKTQPSVAQTIATKLKGFKLYQHDIPKTWGTLPDELNNAAGIAGAAGFTGLVGPLSKIAGLAMDITDGNMWVSVGWIALGLGLTVVGLLMLFRKPIESLAGDVVKAVAL